MELIRGGLAEAFQALPEDEKSKMAEAVRAKAPNAGGLMQAPEFASLPDADKR